MQVFWPQHLQFLSYCVLPLSISPLLCAGACCPGEFNISYIWKLSVFLLPSPHSLYHVYKCVHSLFWIIRHHPKHWPWPKWFSSSGFFCLVWSLVILVNTCWHIIIHSPCQCHHYLGRYCGPSLPHPITSFSNALMLKFVSDSTVNFGGFHATYAASTSGKKCQQVVLLG